MKDNKNGGLKLKATSLVSKGNDFGVKSFNLIKNELKATYLVSKGNDFGELSITSVDK